MSFSENDARWLRSIKVDADEPAPKIEDDPLTKYWRNTAINVERELRWWQVIAGVVAGLAIMGWTR